MPFFGQEIFQSAQDTDGLSDPAYQKARKDATSIAQQAIDDTLAKFDVDAIIAPTNSPAWKTDLINGDQFLVGSSSPAAISGYANITVPARHPVNARQWITVPRRSDLHVSDAEA